MRIIAICTALAQAAAQAASGRAIRMNIDNKRAMRQMIAGQLVGNMLHH